MRFREIADARNAVFFNRTGGFEPGKSSSAERRLRDGLGSWSDHARIVPPLWLEFSLVSGSADFVAGATFCEPPCTDFVAGAALCEPPCADFVAGAALCEPPCTDFVAGAALCEPPCADFVAGAALCEPPGADFVAGTARCEPPCAGTALCEPPCADFVAGATLCEPPCTDFVAGTALCEPPCADFVAGAALCEPPCADFVAGAIQNAFLRDSGRTKCCIFNRTGGFEPGKSSSAERRLRDGLGSWSDHARIVPPLWLEFSLVS